MTRTLMAGVSLVICAFLAAGCDKQKAEQAMKNAASQAKELTKETREVALKPIEEALPKIEEKIKSLSGEGKIKAEEAFGEVKKLLEQCKAAAPEKWQELKDKLVRSFDDLKKLVGLER
jgi:hypothetical protein